MLETGAVTDNVSGQVGSPVTCHGCESNANEFTRKTGTLGDLHCTACHADGHRACVNCGACMGRLDRYGYMRQGRWDRLYCSSTCRVKALRERERAKLERAAWEAEHPEEALAERAEFEAWAQELRSLGDVVGIRKRDRRAEELKKTAERCAHVGSRKIGEEPVVHPATGEQVGVRGVFERVPCDKVLSPGDVIYRRGHAGPILPFCEEHRCGQLDGYHNADAPGDRFYPTCRCDRGWLKDSDAEGR